MRAIVSLLVLAAATACAASAAERDSGETAIPFVKTDGIIDWKVGADDELFVRGANGGWYLVRTMNRCTRLKTAQTLGFETSALDQLDRFGAILAEGQRCPVASVTRSGEPPKKS